MGGVDKGLQAFRGQPLVAHVLQRLAPQVGAVMISANRNLDRYAALGVPVWPDTQGDFAGPLAGFEAGLAHCTTPYMVTAPCDVPLIPDDLVARLAAGLGQADIAVAATPEDGALRMQPVFCLLKTGLLPSLREFLQSGQGKIGLWVRGHACVQVPFEQSFAGANTLIELQQLQ